MDWRYEGTGWVVPFGSDLFFYRLYNRNGGEHHYTMDLNERNMLINAGWPDEGIGWASDPGKTIPVYREYNPNAFANNHNYTTSREEHDYLISIGWRDEGIGWYAKEEGTAAKPGDQEIPLTVKDAYVTGVDQEGKAGSGGDVTVAASLKEGIVSIDFIYDDLHGVAHYFSKYYNSRGILCWEDDSGLLNVWAMAEDAKGWNWNVYVTLVAKELK